MSIGGELRPSESRENQVFVDIQTARMANQNSARLFRAGSAGDPEFVLVGRSAPCIDLWGQRFAYEDDEPLVGGEVGIGVEAGGCDPDDLAVGGSRVDVPVSNAYGLDLWRSFEVQGLGHGVMNRIEAAVAPGARENGKRLHEDVAQLDVFARRRFCDRYARSSPSRAGKIQNGVSRRTIQRQREIPVLSRDRAVAIDSHTYV